MKVLLLAALALLTTIAPVWAETAPDPVHITGNQFVVDETANLATFTGDVVVTRLNFKLWAPKVVVDYGEGGPSNIKSFTATGGVRIKTDSQDATGDMAVYDPGSKRMHLMGHVLVKSDSGTIGSPDLVVDMEAKTSVFTGSSNGKGRVTGVFTPK